MRIGFHTFGCKLNQFETEALAYPFKIQGFSIVRSDQDAELYIINTCTVTARADHKARTLIRAIGRRRPGTPIVVAGCAAELEAERFRALGPHVIVVTREKKSGLLKLPRYLIGTNLDAPDSSLLKSFLARGMDGRADPFLFQAREQSFHTRAFLKIQDGCDCRCAYCRVPLARGPSASLGIGEVLRRARELESFGYRELVVTGVNISAYRSGESSLTLLLKALLDSTGFPRIRLSSLEPQAVTEELASIVADRRICPHFHLTVQSGSDAVLALMRRRYTSARVLAAAALLRWAKGDPFLAADILVGFPGESAEDFMQSRDLVENARFSSLHVFPFSPRPGTAAAGFARTVPQRIATERAAEMTGLSSRLAREYRSRWIGREVEVLLEDGTQKPTSAARGTSANYMKLSVEGIPLSEPDPTGKLARVVVLSADENGCRGQFKGFLDGF